MVECCLQKPSWNSYYTRVLQHLAAASKVHRVTLQYCLWDQFKLAEQTDMRRLINLAHLTGQLIASFTLSMSILKVQHFLSITTELITKNTVLTISVLAWRNHCIQNAVKYSQLPCPYVESVVVLTVLIKSGYFFDSFFFL